MAAWGKTEHLTVAEELATETSDGRKQNSSYYKTALKTTNTKHHTAHFLLSS